MSYTSKRCPVYGAAKASGAGGKRQADHVRPAWACKQVARPFLALALVSPLARTVS